MSIVDQIEEVRRQNNKNWMDILRLALKAAPTEAKEILARINAADKEISVLIGKLANDDDH